MDLRKQGLPIYFPHSFRLGVIAKMAKLTLTFKGKMLQSQILAEGTYFIGRDIVNDIQIDSLAVAPRHASVTFQGSETLVKQLDPAYPLVINGNLTEEHKLKHGDRIGVGKHQIYFSDTDPALTGFPSLSTQSFTHTVEEPPQIHPTPITPTLVEASLQVLKGKNIGVVIPLRRAMTRLGTESSGSAVIAHRKDGYFLSALVSSSNVKVNDIEVREDSVQLNHGDILKVGQNTLQFFCQ